MQNGLFFSVIYLLKMMIRLILLDFGFWFWWVFGVFFVCFV